MAPFWQRYLRAPSVEQLPIRLEPKRLLTEPIETKASSMSLLPVGAYGPNYVFFSPDGGRTMVDISDGPATLAFVAYWYVATRWRAQKIAEPPLMVVQEDQDTGDEEWLSDHELIPVLEDPSPDYDMGELLETTSIYLDNTGFCLWVKDEDTIGRVARITPFSRNEFEPQRGTDRLFDHFNVNTLDGPREYDAEQCVFFRDVQGHWGRGRSRLDIALSWLKLGTKAQQTVYDLLSNSVWPSAAIVPDKDWDPDPKTYEAYKQDLQNYAKGGNKGKPFVALGGGQFIPLTAAIKDLVPDEVLDRVESMVAAVTGVPAIVLQFLIGLKNSPWSQMAQARRMAYDDVIQPAWRKIERVVTKQLLRPVDDDPTHFIRFDASTVAALQQDQLMQAQIAALMGRAASLNERRAVMGLEPATSDQDPDNRANDIPELTTPSFAQLLAGGNPNDPNNPNGGNASGNSKDPQAPKDGLPEKDSTKKTARRLWFERKFKAATLQDAFQQEALPVYRVHAHQQLQHDAERIAEIVMHELLDPAEAKSIETKSRGKDRAMASVAKYLNEDGRASWTRAMQPLNVRSAERSGAVVASDLNLNFSVLHGNLLTYAKKQTAKQITTVNSTTKDLVSDIIQGGIDANADTREIANLIRDATGFDQARAELIARTELTKAFNGAPTESLVMAGEASGRKFTKTWSGVLDDRERDEHVAMEGETVAIDDTFSNGLMYPSEPNCRCVLLYDEVTED